jgi:MFS family permease
MTRDLRTARSRAILTFVLAGLMCGTFTVRIPALTDRLGISEASVALVLLAWGVGALVTMQSMRGVMARAGSRAVLRACAPLCAASLLGVALAPSLPSMVVVAALFGMFFGAVDVAMNAQGSAVERAYGRPLMNGMHAGWCVGAMSAGLLGTVAISFGVSFTANLAAIALVSAPGAYWLSRGFLPDPVFVEPASGAARRRMPPVVYLLGAIAFGAFMVEGAVADWNGLFLRDTVVAVGGMILIGLTVATVSPMAISLAGTATGNPGPAIAQTGAMGYAGLLLGPVVIGFLSHAATLRVALGVAVVLGVLISVAAYFLPRRESRTAGAEIHRLTEREPLKAAA